MESVLAHAVEILSLGWVGSLLGIIAIVLSILFWFYQRRPTRLVEFVVESDLLIDVSKSILREDLTLTYKGRQVPRVCQIRVRFWNAGVETIEGTSIAKKDPIQIVLIPSDALLLARLTRTTREVNATKIKAMAQGEFLISFDYLDPKDGAFFDILHTSDSPRIGLFGTFRGQSRGPEQVRFDDVACVTLLQVCRFILVAASILFFGLTATIYFSESLGFEKFLKLLYGWILFTASPLIVLFALRDPIPEKMSYFPRYSILPGVK